MSDVTMRISLLENHSCRDVRREQLNRSPQLPMVLAVALCDLTEKGLLQVTKCEVQTGGKGLKRHSPDGHPRIELIADLFLVAVFQQVPEQFDRSK